MERKECTKKSVGLCPMGECPYEAEKAEVESYGLETYCQLLGEFVIWAPQEHEGG